MPRGRTPEQARSLERRARVLSAASGLLLAHGSGAVTHRRVAEASESAPGAVRYYFGTRSELLGACLEEIEQRRIREAEAVIGQVRDSDSDEAHARMLLRVYYGPDLNHRTIVGTVRSFVDCSREDPHLAERLATHRQRSIAQLQQLLDRLDRGHVEPELIAVVLDGAILAAMVSGSADVIDAAVVTLTRVLRGVG